MPANYEQPTYLDKRLRYFDGQFLKDQDFIDEQKYHVDRTRRLSRSLQVSGVSEGLAVTVAGSDRVTVNPGTGVDPKGRLIVLATPENVSLVSYRNQTVSLLISYQEIEADRAQEGTEGNRRWHEKPLIQVALPGTTAVSEAIVLANLNVDKDGVVKVDNSVRQYSGVYLPAAGGKGPILRSGGDGASNKAVLTGDLSVSGTLEVNSLSIGSGGLNLSNATINGNLSASGSITGSSLSVGNGNITAGSATFSGDLSFGTTTRQMINLLPPSYGIGVQSNTEYFRTAQNFAWYKGGSHNDTELNAGGGTLQMAIVDGNVGIGTAAPQAKLDVAGMIRASGYKITSYTAGGINSPAVKLSSVNKILDFPDLSSTFTLSAPAPVIVYYLISNLIFEGHLVTWLLVDNNVVTRQCNGIGTLSNNNIFVNNSDFWMGELAAGTHTIKVQYRCPTAPTNDPSGTDHQNRVLRVIVLGDNK